MKQQNQLRYKKCNSWELYQRNSINQRILNRLIYATLNLHLVLPYYTQNYDTKP